MERRKLRAAKPGDDYVTRRKPFSVVGNGIPTDDAYLEALRRLYGGDDPEEAVGTLVDELHDIRVELKNHGELFERIAVALEKIAGRYVG